MDRDNLNERFNSEMAMNTSISDYIINSYLKGKIVYCRLGEKYITDLEKRKNS